MPIIKYIGSKPVFRDHIFGTGLEWTPGQAHPVSAAVAEQMLRFPTFDEGDGEEPSQEAPPITDQTEERVEEEVDHPLVNLEAMTKADLVQYAHRNFGVVLDPSMKKPELIETVRLQMGKRPA